MSSRQEPTAVGQSTAGAALGAHGGTRRGVAARSPRCPAHRSKEPPAAAASEAGARGTKIRRRGPRPRAPEAWAQAATLGFMWLPLNCEAKIETSLNFHGRSAATSAHMRSAFPPAEFNVATMRRR